MIRVVRNVADTGRTIVCTIHQPAIDIFEAISALALNMRHSLLQIPKACQMSVSTAMLDVTQTRFVRPGGREPGNNSRRWSMLLCATFAPKLQAFDTMLLLKRGGETIFNGPLGFQSRNMISYFESIPGVNITT